MQNFLPQKQSPATNDASTRDPPAERIEQIGSTNTPEIQDSSQRTRRKRRQVDGLDNYKITGRTNIITYQQRLQTYRNCLNAEVSEQHSTPRFKRQLSTSSPEGPVSSKKNVSYLKIITIIPPPSNPR